MAEILCGLSSDDGKMFMPMRELSPENQTEVYEVAGLDLHTGLSLLGDAFMGDGCYLIRLNDGRQVAFPFVMGKIDELSQ